MDQWINKTSVLKDLMELTQGEVHVTPENFITTNKPQRIYVEEEIDEELKNIDPEHLHIRTAPDLKAIPELLSMVRIEEREENFEEQHLQKLNAPENQEAQGRTETSLCLKEPNNSISKDKELSQRSESLTKQTYITSPKHGKMLTDPASMFKKKASPKQIPNIPINASESAPTVNIGKTEYKSSNCAEQLYKEFKTKEEAYKKSKDTVWTKLYRDLEERDKKIISKRKENLSTQGADLT